MKLVYCIAITACLTVIWLYEEKKKRGMAGKLCWKAAAGYLITRFVFFAISKSPTTSSTGGLILALQRAILLLAPQGGVTSTFTGPL